MCPEGQLHLLLFSSVASGVRNLSKLFDYLGYNFPHFSLVQDYKLYVPSKGADDGLKNACRQQILRVIRAGRYTELTDVNKAIQLMGRFFSEQLNESVRNSACYQMIEFALWQYEQAARIDALYLDGKLHEMELRLWSEYGPIIRRALKLLIEVTLMYPLDRFSDIPHNQLAVVMEQPYVSAISLVEFSILSDQIYHLFPKSSAVEIFERGPQLYELESPVQKLFPHKDRMLRDANDRWEFISCKPIELDISEQSRLLTPAFQDAVGVSYSDALCALRSINEHIAVIDNSFPIQAIHRTPLQNAICREFGWSQNATSRVIDGFTLTPEAVGLNGRERWNSRVSERLLRKGFVQTSHRDGAVLMWSYSMAAEGIMRLAEGATFQQFPSAWRTDNVNSKLGTISRTAGKWLETVCQAELQKFGIQSIVSQKNSIGKGSAMLKIPDEIGELDVLAYSPDENLFLFLECKMLMATNEPKAWKGELDQFNNRKNGFNKKFAKKANWLKAHIVEVIAAMQSVNVIESDKTPAFIAEAIVTFYPSIATHFDNDHQCLSVCELIRGYKEKSSFPGSLKQLVTSRFD
jgi:hypothetical protein